MGAVAPMHNNSKSGVPRMVYETRAYLGGKPRFREPLPQAAMNKGWTDPCEEKYTPDYYFVHETIFGKRFISDFAPG
jgi:hypothetical protein